MKNKEDLAICVKYVTKYQADLRGADGGRKEQSSKETANLGTQNHLCVLCVFCPESGPCF